MRASTSMSASGATPIASRPLAPLRLTKRTPLRSAMKGFFELCAFALTLSESFFLSEGLRLSQRLPLLAFLGFASGAGDGSAGRRLRGDTPTRQAHGRPRG